MPETLSPADFAARYGGQPPAPELLSPEEFQKRYGAPQPPSVADEARQRLAARGLTPEKVKAGGGVSSPDGVSFEPPAEPNGGFGINVLKGLNPLHFHMDPITKTIFAVLGKGDYPGMQGVRAAEAHGVQPGAWDAVSGALQEAGLPDIPGTALEASRRGPENVSTKDMAGRATGALVTAAAAGPVLRSLPAAAPAARSAAIEQYTDVMSPKIRNASVAEKVIPEMLDRRMVTTDPRGNLAPALRQQAGAAGQAVADAKAAHAGDAVDIQPILDAIEAEKDQFRSPVPLQGPRVSGNALVPMGARGQASIDYLDEIAADLQKHAPGGKMDFASAIRWRDFLKLRPQQSDAFANPKLDSAARVELDKIGSNAIARGLNDAFPDLADANKEYGFTKDAFRVAAGAPQPKGGVWPAVQAEAAAHLMRQFGSTRPLSFALDAYAAGKIIKQVWNSPAWNTASAVMKSEFSKAVASKNYDKVADMASTVFEVKSLSNAGAQQQGR